MSRILYIHRSAKVFRFEDPKTIANVQTSKKKTFILHCQGFFSQNKFTRKECVNQQKFQTNSYLMLRPFSISSYVDESDTGCIVILTTTTYLIRTYFCYNFFFYTIPKKFLL